MNNEFFAVVTGVFFGFAIAGIMAMNGAWIPGDPFITLNNEDVYTHEEYHERIEDQILEFGYTALCIYHLGNVQRPNHISDFYADDSYVLASAWRTIEVQSEVCNSISSGRTQ